MINKKMKLVSIVFALMFIVMTFVLVSAADTTPPATSLYIGQDNDGGHNTFSYKPTIWANVLNVDSQSNVITCQMDWGDGAGWEVVSAGTEDTWYSVSHTYPTLGTKTITYRCQNSDGYWSSGTTLHEDRDSIEIIVDAPAVAIYLGQNQGSHNIQSFSTTIYANIWNDDNVYDVTQCRIDWGEGVGWENVAIGTEDNWYAVSHTYANNGTKTVRYQCGNDLGYWSQGNLQHEDWDSIEILYTATPPVTGIYLGETALVHNDYTSSMTIYANLWNTEYQTTVTQCRIDWNDFGGWESVTTGPDASWHSVSHTYTTYGTKTILYQCQNSEGLWSSPGQIFTLHEGTDMITIQDVVTLDPTVTIWSPLEGFTYSSTTIPLRVTADQTINSWRYSLNGGANISFTPNITITAVEGFNTITVWGSNANGVGSDTATFNVNTGGPTNPPVINIINPVQGNTYNSIIIPLDVTADQAISTWYYSLNGGANTVFIPNTTIIGVEGANTLIVYGINPNGLGSDSVSWNIDTSGPANPPVINIINPVQGNTYTSITVPLDVTSNQPIDSWRYSLNGGANISFTPNTTVTGIEGLNTITVWGINTNGIGTETVSWTIDTSGGSNAPNVNIINPVQGNTYTSITIPLDVTANQHINVWLYSLNGQSNVSFNPNTTITGVEGSNTIQVWGINVNGTGTDSVTFNINTGGPSNPPTINIVNPVNGQTYNNTLIALDVTSDQGIATWLYSLNGAANVSFTPNTTITGVEGSNTLVVYGTNLNGMDSDSVTFNVNTSGSNIPNINVIRPVDGNEYSSKTISLRVTADQPIDNWWYVLNGGSNKAFTPNTTFTAKEGNNNIIVYGNNSNGTGAMSINFKVDTDDDDDPDDNNGGTIILRVNDKKGAATLSSKGASSSGAIDLSQDRGDVCVRTQHWWIWFFIAVLIILAAIILNLFLPYAWLAIWSVAVIALMVLFWFFFPCVWLTWVSIALILIVVLIILRIIFG